MQKKLVASLAVALLCNTTFALQIIDDGENSELQKCKAEVYKIKKEKYEACENNHEGLQRWQQRNSDRR